MHTKLAQEILMTHADILAKGEDVTEVMSRRYPELAPLFKTAVVVAGCLHIVPVSAEFVTHLHAELMRSPLPVATNQKVNNGWMVGAAVGSAVTGIAVYAARRFFNTHHGTATA